jgi:hypothetical protein
VDVVYQYSKIFVGNMRQMLLQISIFEVLSGVLSCFLDFSANLFPRFHFSSANESVHLLRGSSLASYGGNFSLN